MKSVSTRKISKASAMFLAVVFMFSILISPALAADNSLIPAIPNASKVIVNGSVVSFEAYNINNNNYFKLRDLAKVVSGTDKQFEITWDASKKAINLVSGQAYTVVGGELKQGDGASKSAVLSTAKIYKNGSEVKLTAYTISDNNFFKLRDVAQLFDIGVTWDAATSTVGIDTAASYNAPAASTPEPSAPYDGKVTNEEYQEAMGPLVAAYEEMIAATNELLAHYDGSDEWIDAFATVYKESNNVVDAMLSITEYVPSDYQVAHNNITFAMAAYTDAFMAMAEMIDAVEAGQDTISDQKMGEYIGLFVAAEVLWDSAVE